MPGVIRASAETQCLFRWKKNYGMPFLVVKKRPSKVFQLVLTNKVLPSELAFFKAFEHLRDSKHEPLVFHLNYPVGHRKHTKFPKASLALEEVRRAGSTSRGELNVAAVKNGLGKEGTRYVRVR